MMQNDYLNEQFLAHISEERIQTVLEHLQGTARLSASYADAFGAADQGRLLGLAHDIGKCSKEFQERLRGGNIVDHASAGALECIKTDPEAMWAACCIAGHHGGLPDVGNMKMDQEGDATLCGRIKKAAAGMIPPYKMPLDIPVTASPPGYGENALEDSFIIRMLYSCLVDADYLDTEMFMDNKSMYSHCSCRD